MRRLLLLLAFLALPFAAPRPALAQDVDSLWVAEHYVKMDTLIPMRDGVRLYTAIYLPKDRSRPHPVILRRTPYMPINTLTDLAAAVPAAATLAAQRPWRWGSGRWRAPGCGWTPFALLLPLLAVALIRLVGG